MSDYLEMLEKLKAADADGNEPKNVFVMHVSPSSIGDISPISSNSTFPLCHNIFIYSHFYSESYIFPVLTKSSLSTGTRLTNFRNNERLMLRTKSASNRSSKLHSIPRIEQLRTSHLTHSWLIYTTRANTQAN